MSSGAKFAFICGDDEFLVSDKGKAWFKKKRKIFQMSYLRRSSMLVEII